MPERLELHTGDVSLTLPHWAVFVACAIATVACGDPARITGRVVDNFGAPVEGATVHVPNTAFSTTTTASGEFSLEYAPGAFTVMVDGPVVEASREVSVTQLVPYPIGQIDVVRVPPAAGVHVAGVHAFVALEAIVTRTEIGGAGTHRFNSYDPPRDVLATMETIPENATLPAVDAGADLIAFADAGTEANWLLVALHEAFLTAHCAAAPLPRAAPEGVRCPNDDWRHSARLVDLELTPDVPGNRVLLRAHGLTAGSGYCLVRGLSSDRTRRRLWRYNQRFVMDYEPTGFLGALRGHEAWCFQWGSAP